MLNMFLVVLLMRRLKVKITTLPSPWGSQPFALDSQAKGEKQYPEFSACHVVCNHHNDLCRPARMDPRARSDTSRYL